MFPFLSYSAFSQAVAAVRFLHELHLGNELLAARIGAAYTVQPHNLVFVRPNGTVLRVTGDRPAPCHLPELRRPRGDFTIPYQFVPPVRVSLPQFRPKEVSGCHASQGSSKVLLGYLFLANCWLFSVGVRFSWWL